MKGARRDYLPEKETSKRRRTRSRAPRRLGFPVVTVLIAVVAFVTVAWSVRAWLERKPVATPTGAVVPLPGIGNQEPNRGATTSRGSSTIGVRALADAGSANSADDGVESALPPVTGPLARTFRALESLRRGKRRDPVRILWLGDSHTFADFWPDAVRRPLSDRFGAGGPGFLFTGLASYRHAGAHLSRQGTWRVLPDQPALIRRQEDGVFGLGGMRAIPDAPDAVLKLQVDRDDLPGDALWDLCFRLAVPSAGFRIQGDGMRPILVDTSTVPLGTLQHVRWSTPAPATVTIDGMEGAPEFFGVVVESSNPGVVLDSVGIIGARVATALSWEPTQWIDELRRRAPTLAVVAYGTNECGDGAPVSVYAAQYKALLGRIRAASPLADCVIVGPTDRVIKLGSPGRVRAITLVQQQAAAALGCAFFSTQEAMGGVGGFTKWASADDALTSPDGVHLAPNGYTELGAQMVRVLLSERPGLPSLP